MWPSLDIIPSRDLILFSSNLDFSQLKLLGKKTIMQDYGVQTMCVPHSFLHTGIEKDEQQQDATSQVNDTDR